MATTTTKKEKFINGTGRRKTAVARVWLYEKKGEFTINGMPIEEYFPTEKELLAWKKPFHLVGVSHPESQYSASIKVHGSGKSAQLGAVSLGFSRALASINEDFAVILRKNGMLTRDSRMVERKKYWFRKARKQPQYSKR
jgi:small subunit ribosomal protein S9